MQFIVSAVAVLGDATPGQARAGWLSFLRGAQSEIGPMVVKRGEDDESGVPLGATDAVKATEADEGFMASGGGLTAEVANDRPPGRKTVDAVRATFWWENPPNDKVESLLSKLKAWGPDHGLVVATAGASGERRSQMFIMLKLPKGSIETFAGKNHRAYLPGLFWWNWWDERALDRLDVSVDTLPREWRAERVPANDAAAIVVRGGYDWREWMVVEGGAAKWAEGQRGVFSKRTLNAAVPDKLNEITALRFLRQWR